MDARRLLELPLFYRLFQQPFIRAKLNPVLESRELFTAKSVLDLGCGPGTNTPFFEGKEYVGIDISFPYVVSAHRSSGRAYVVCDAACLPFASTTTFDIVLSNSLLHHLDDAHAERTLRAAREHLSAQGTIHVLDLIRPPRSLRMASVLATLDRGHYPRTLEIWREMFLSVFRQIEFFRYHVGCCSARLWEMVYFKGALP